MSYDITLNDPITGSPCQLGHNHEFTGGTYDLNGTSECWLNVTYNYSEHYRRVFADERGIYGLTGYASLPILQNAADALSDDVDVDYWKPTEGNARRALLFLIELAKLRPEGVWNGD